VRKSESTVRIRKRRRTKATPSKGSGSGHTGPGGKDAAQRLGEELRASEEQLLFILESAGMGTWDWDVRSGQLVWSERGLEIFGIPAGTELTYERFLSALHPEEREPVDQAVQMSLSQNQDYSIEMRAVWPDGSIHWVLSRGRAYFDAAGKPVRMSGAAMDITRLKHPEENLKQARGEAKVHADNMMAIFDAVPAAVFFSHDRQCERITSNLAAYELRRMAWWRYDAATNSGSWDDTFKTIFRITANSLPTQEILKHIHPDDIARMMAEFEADFNSAEPRRISGNTGLCCLTGRRVG
jgi:PAS domain S-box-containing protein